MNEVIFFIWLIVSLGFVLIAHRLGRVYLFGLIAAMAVLMNIFVVKGMYLFGLAATGGNILYASIFLATDILSENYGKKEALRGVRIGFFVSLFFLAGSQAIVLFKPADFDIAHGAMQTLFFLTPRIVIGSMIAYLISQHLDVWLFEKIRKKTKGKHLWLRNNGSTMVSQMVDSALFTLIAFWGVYPKIIQIIIFTYIIKVIIAACDTPFVYLSRRIKKIT